MPEKITKNRQIIFITAFLTISYLIPFIPIERLLCALKDSPNLVAAVFIGTTVLTTGISMLIQFAIVYEISRLNWKRCLFLILYCFVLILLTVVWIHYDVNKIKAFPKNISYLNQIIIVINNMGSLAVFPKIIYSLLIIILCASFGSILSNLIKERNMLIPVMLCCAFIDIWTVTVGFVAKTLETAPNILGAVSSTIPMVGGKTFLSLGTIGAGDFIFPAMVFACAFKFNFNKKRNFWFMFGFLYAGMLLVILNIVPMLPALTCVTAATIIVNRKEFTLSKKEIGYMGIVFSLLTLVLIISRTLLK